MQNAPKIVADRLKAVVPLANHPDADLLTAFSEQALSAHERAAVLEHIACCGDCREIVALALPAPEPVEQLVRPAPGGWLTWQFLRWGFVGVGVVAIAAFGLVQYRRSSTHLSPMASFVQPESARKEAQNQLPPSPASSETASQQDKVKIPAMAISPTAGNKIGGAAAPMEQYDQLEAAESRTNRDREKKVIAAVPHGKPLQDGHGPRVQYQANFQYNARNSVANGQAPAAPLPYASKQIPNAFMPTGANAPAASTTAAQGQSIPVDVQGKNEEALVLQNTMPLKPIEGGQGQTVERAKDADGIVVSRTVKVPSGAIPAPAAASSFALAPPSASWTITAGALRRSLDQGKTWQDINVNATPSGASFAYPAQVAQAQTVDNKNDVAAKSAQVLPVFRSVAANGADVWAGASNGLLYHSVDSGAHWMHIFVFSGSMILTGDVVSLDFPDAQHGKITTSTPEVWLTSDGGKTWQKQ